METYKNTRKLKRYVFRVSKEESSYLYFTLESHEGLAIYSTLSESLKKQYRDILLHCPIELVPQVDHLIETCRKMFEIEILESQVVEDHPEYFIKL